MDQEKNMDEVLDPLHDTGEESVDDFIKQLEEKEKDLHITVETSIIEIEASFDDHDDSEFSLLSSPSISLPNISKPLAKPVRSATDAQVAELKATVARMEAERDEIFKNNQRRAKDFEAFKTRAERERTETFQNQIGNLATLMLPALDNLHRALDSAEHLPGEKSESFQNFYDGVGMVSEQMAEILNKMGIRPIATVGEPFDPHYHEAVATEETDQYPPNTICGELLRGYMAGDKVIRHSLVKVSQAAALSAATPAPLAPVDQQSTESSSHIDEFGGFELEIFEHGSD
jgi:molecular chaperone GrpE